MDPISLCPAQSSLPSLQLFKARGGRADGKASLVAWLSYGVHIGNPNHSCEYWPHSQAGCRKGAEKGTSQCKARLATRHGTPPPATSLAYWRAAFQERKQTMGYTDHISGALTKGSPINSLCGAFWFSGKFRKGATLLVVM